MSTIRQKKLAKALVENAISSNPMNKQELVASVGYSDLSAEKKATEIIESKGTQEELDALGFDVESAKKVVIHIMRYGKEDNRLNAAKEIFKVRGEYAPEKHVNLNISTVLDQIENE